MHDLDTAILEGLQLLLTLRLSGAPAEDTIDAVADVWLLTFKRGRSIDWQEGDGERVRAAFVTIAAHAERWPTPSQVLDRLPPRPERPRLPRPTRPMPPEVRAQLDELLARLLISDRPRAAGFDETTWPAVAERLKSSGQWLVASGQQGSGQGLVASGQQTPSSLATSHSSLATALATSHSPLSTSQTGDDHD